MTTRQFCIKCADKSPEQPLCDTCEEDKRISLTYELDHLLAKPLWLIVCQYTQKSCVLRLDIRKLAYDNNKQLDQTIVIEPLSDWWRDPIRIDLCNHVYAMSSASAFSMLGRGDRDYHGDNIYYRFEVRQSARGANVNNLYEWSQPFYYQCRSWHAYTDSWLYNTLLDDKSKNVKFDLYGSAAWPLKNMDSSKWLN